MSDNFCPKCGEHFILHDNGCPEDNQPFPWIGRGGGNLIIVLDDDGVVQEEYWITTDESGYIPPPTITYHHLDADTDEDDEYYEIDMRDMERVQNNPEFGIRVEKL